MCSEEDKNRKWGLTGFMGPWPWAKRMSQAHPLWNSWWNKGPIWIGQIIGKILREHLKDRGLFTMNNLSTTFRIPRGRSSTRKQLELQGKEAKPHYYKSPNTLSHQGTHNRPFSSTLELWEYISNLIFGGYLAGSTPAHSARCSCFLLL